MTAIDWSVMIDFDNVETVASGKPEKTYEEIPDVLRAMFDSFDGQGWIAVPLANGAVAESFIKEARDYGNLKSDKRNVRANRYDNKDGSVTVRVKFSEHTERKPRTTAATVTEIQDAA